MLNENMWQTYKSYTLLGLFILSWCGTHVLWKSLLHNEHARSVSLTLYVQLKHILLLSLVFSTLDWPAMSFFTFLFSHSFFLSSLAISSLFLCSFSLNKAFHVYMLLQMYPLCIPLKLSFQCVWPLQSFLDSRNVFTVKPVFRSCNCARIFIEC